MNKEHNVSIIKFKTIFHHAGGAIIDRETFFYPAANFQYFKKINNDFYGIPELKSIDKFNKKILFQYMKYNEDLQKYFRKAEEFNSNLWLMKGLKLQTFYNLMCDYILKLATTLYYRNFYKFEAQGAPLVALNVLELYLDIDDSEAVDFTFDHAFSIALNLEQNMKKDFLKILDEEYPTFDPAKVVKGEESKNTHENPKDNKVLDSKQAKRKGQPN